MKIHTEITKVWKYFKNKQICPFERVGCMFSHVEVDSDNEASSEDVVDVTEDRDDEETFIPCENQCHVCKQQMESHDDLWDHVQTKHEEYYNGVLEAAANLSTTNF